MGNKLSNRGIIGDQKATLIRALLFSAIAVVPVVSSSVLANTSIDEIIVTASKREQTLQETPIAVSVVGKQEITRASVSGISDLQILLPSLRVTTVQTSAGQNLNIRGFGNGSNNTGIEPSVGVFIDGVVGPKTAILDGQNIFLIFLAFAKFRT